jgi:predicted transcriptional regulator
MSALKPASLTSALLTRKGMASPSAVPASRANMVESMPSQPPLPTETPPSPATPEPTPLRANPPDRIRPKQKAGESVPTARRSAEKRVRVSLRLDVDRHLRLKLVATHLNRTMQSVFVQAIDEYFERHTPDMSDAIALLRIRERGEKDGIEGERKSRGNRDAGEH